MFTHHSFYSPGLMLLVTSARGLWATVGLTNGDEWLEMTARLNTQPTEWRQEFFSRNITIQYKENDIYIKCIYVLSNLQCQEEKPLML